MSRKAKIWMNSVMHRIMLSCDTATLYITKREYEKLSCVENLQLRIHLMGCKFCRAFNKQNTLISEKIKTMQEEPPQIKLSAVKKAEIQHSLDQNI